MMIGIAAMPNTMPAASVRKVRGTGTSPPATNTSASTAAEAGLSSPQRRRKSTRAWVMSNDMQLDFTRMVLSGIRHAFFAIHALSARSAP